jgi:hypothetical protein
MPLARLIAGLALATALSPHPAGATSFSQGEFVSYDQSIWGGPVIPGTPPQLVHDNFSTLYPGVLELGIPQSSGGHFIDFTDSGPLLIYLPQSAPAAALNANVTDPDSSTAGIFGGQTAALRLNIDFSDAGLIDHPSGVTFGDLVFTGLTGSLAGLDGMTVRQLSTIANVLLGGGVAPYTIAAVSPFLTDVNASFQGGFVSAFAQDHFDLPEVITTPVPESSTWSLMLLAIAGLVLQVRRKRMVST